MNKSVVAMIYNSDKSHEKDNEYGFTTHIRLPNKFNKVKSINREDLTVSKTKRQSKCGHKSKSKKSVKTYCEICNSEGGKLTEVYVGRMKTYQYRCSRCQ